MRRATVAGAVCSATLRSMCATRFAIVFVALFLGCGSPAVASGASAGALAAATERLSAAAAALAARAAFDSYPAKTALPSGADEWSWAYSSGWTSGFWPGLLWQAAAHGGNATLAGYAQRWTAGRAVEENNTGTHDVGFMVGDSFGKGLALWGARMAAAQRAQYERVLLRTAASLATRWSPVVGMLRSWGDRDDMHTFEVIIDNLMNLELLWQAAMLPGGNGTWAEMAEAHALKTGDEWLRSDGSTFHLVVFSPVNGSVLSRSGTPQGLAVNSTWARGQAWAIYGFTMAYRYTHNPAFLRLAANVSDYWLNNVPADGVPKWDFDAEAPNDQRDTSAAAIVASAFLELTGYTGNDRYSAAAQHILASLGGAPYLGSSSPQPTVALLTHNFHDCGSDLCSIIESDYYYYQALRRAAGQGM